MGLCLSTGGKAATVMPGSPTTRAAYKAPAASSGKRDSLEIGYVTDIEGNLDYFDRWVERSRVLRYKPGTTELELTHDRAYFVFGGDVQDRCGGSLRLTRRLVELKKRNPEKVFLICGNRDLNKLRFTSELGAADLARPASEIPGPHWDPNAPTLHKYLSDLAETQGTTAEALDTRCERLRYYLKHTLGCPTTFEDRRGELGVLQGDGGSSSYPEGKQLSVPISDDAVVDSFLADIGEGGALRGYLEHGSLACVLGNTIFVHGCLDSSNIKLVPSDSTRFHLPLAPQPMHTVEGVREWADAMNSYLQRGVQAHVQRPEWDAERQTRGCDMLLAAQNRCAMWGRCIISGAYADGGCITSPNANATRERISAEAESTGNPIIFERTTSDPRDPVVAEWLLAAGVRRIVVGHKPSGDSPAVLSSSYTGVEVLSCDTSYADLANDKRTGRGKAISWVRIEGESLDRNAATVSGCLADGRAHEATLATLSSAGQADDVPGDEPHVGTELEDGWWVKARLLNADAPGTASNGGEKAKLGGEGQAAGQTYHLCQGEGRTVNHKDAVL